MVKCDLIAKLKLIIVQYWDINGSENLPNFCQSRFRILPSTTSTLFQFRIELRGKKDEKINKKRPGLTHIQKKYLPII